MSELQRKMSKDQILKFVKLIEQHPVIWDHTLRDHRDTNVCDAAWVEIREQMLLDPVEVSLRDLRRWWKGFRDTFRDNLQRVKEAVRSGNKDHLHPAWWLWEPMQFARPFINTKGGEEHCASKFEMRKRKLLNSSMDLCLSQQQQLTHHVPQSQPKRSAIQTSFLEPSLNRNFGHPSIISSCSQVFRSPKDGAAFTPAVSTATPAASSSRSSSGSVLTYVDEKEKDRFDRWAEYAATELRQLPTDDALDLLNKYQHLLSAKWLEIAKRAKKSC